MSLNLRAAVAEAAMAAGPVIPDEQCCDFSNQTADAAFAPGALDPANIGEGRVHKLLAGGMPIAKDSADTFLRVLDQEVAGGEAPEMYGKYVAVKRPPANPVRRITLKVSHQPGAGDGRAAFIEISGERHEFNGSLAQLDGRTLGTRSQARVKVDLPTTNGNFVGGRLGVESKSGIRSFTIGAGEMGFDDVCLTK